VTDNDALGRSAYAGSRVSPQRIAIARAADGVTSAFSVEDLIAAVRRDAPGVGAATVYRAVAAMQAAGFVEALGTRGGSALYARCRSGGHHHHLVCTGCGAVADAECAMVPASFPAPAGFHVTGHDLVLYGECAKCRDEARRPVTSVETKGGV
jgi:Fe2+ or Zn2+ uptake regulation protein